jgi:flavin reductase (DIM6/NTAB) family NADH-FMN oxidoreductase RutF
LPLSWFWTPLVVVTAAAGGRRSGQVALSVHGASIVPERPRLSAGLWKGNLTRDLVEEAGAFAVHLLRDDQDELIYHFGMASGHDVDKFAIVAFETGTTGAPIVPGCLAAFECRVVNAMDAGDHTIFLGDVVATHAGAPGEPLWWRDLRTRMPEPWTTVWDERSARNAEVARGTMDAIERR